MAKPPKAPLQPMEAGVKVIRKRRMAAEDKRDAKSLLLRVVVLALAVWVLCTQVFLLTQADGNGMFPAVKDGDLLIGYRLQDVYSKNDVVVYLHEGKLCTGRILARGTDVVNIDEAGNLIVNGTVQSGEILYPTYATEGGISYPYRVPEGTVFILGDYRTQSQDSRSFGAVDLSDVQAKVITLLRRRSL